MSLEKNFYTEQVGETDERFLSVEFFRALSQYEQKIITKNAAFHNKFLLENFFSSSSANWLVIAGTSIVAMGTDPDQLNNVNINEIERDRGLICFVYYRPEGYNEDRLHIDALTKIRIDLKFRLPNCS